MKKKEIVERLAEAGHIPMHTAADLLDMILHDLLKSIREGGPAEVPGIGELKAPEIPKRSGGGRARR